MNTCTECGYPHDGISCPNPACPNGKTGAHKAHIEQVRAERAKRQAADDEFFANFRRFYHGRR